MLELRDLYKEMRQEAIDHREGRTTDSAKKAAALTPAVKGGNPWDSDPVVE